MGIFKWFRKAKPVTARLPVHANMGTVPTTMAGGRSVECGSCGGVSAHSVLAAFSLMGTPDLDLRPPPTARNKLHILMQRCPHCGYCARNIGQPPVDPEVVKSVAYQAALARTDFPELARRFLASAVASSESDPFETASAYLQAAWVCDDAYRYAQAVESRRLAAEAYCRAQPFEDDNPGVTLGAVLVDILRRSGQFTEAAATCTSLLGMRAVVGDIRDVLEFQHRLISKRDVGAYRVSDISKDAEPLSGP
jgi:hypothetical protein